MNSICIYGVPHGQRNDLAHGIFSGGPVARIIRPDAVMVTLSTLLLDNGLPEQPVSLIEPHRNHVGIWRIKFCYDDVEPLSMTAEQASKLAAGLHQMGQDELACEIDEAVGRARHYEAM